MKPLEEKVDRYSLANLIGWLAAQPPEKTFNALDPYECLFGQFVRAQTGATWRERWRERWGIHPGWARKANVAIESNRLWVKYGWLMTCRTDFTFGAALETAKEYQRSR